MEPNSEPVHRLESACDNDCGQCQLEDDHPRVVNNMCLEYHLIDLLVLVVGCHAPFGFREVPKVMGREVSRCLAAGVESVEASERRLVLDTFSENPSTHQSDAHNPAHQARLGVHYVGLKGVARFPI